MRSEFLHNAAFYASEEEFLSVVVPFLEDGQFAGERALVAVSDHRARLLRTALSHPENVTFLPGDAAYRRPASTIRTMLELFREHVKTSSQRIRITGEVLDSGPGAPRDWDPWARFEAAINDLFRDFPVSALCLYDARTTPARVREEIEHTHPRLSTSDQPGLINDRYQEPAAFLAERSQPRADPIERTAPRIALVDPSAAAARRAVGELASGSAISRDDERDLIWGVSEAIANAHVHGRAPVELRGWSTPDRLVICIRDSGSGPSDPYAGLVPATPGAGGLGLWIAHQTCAHVVHVHAHDGFTIRFTAHFT